jgi:hypothetical protein
LRPGVLGNARRCDSDRRNSFVEVRKVLEEGIESAAWQALPNVLALLGLWRRSIRLILDE